MRVVAHLGLLWRPGAVYTSAARRLWCGPADPVEI